MENVYQFLHRHYLHQCYEILSVANDGITLSGKIH